MTLFLWVFMGGICLLVIVWVTLRSLQRSSREREIRYVRRLEETQQYLQQHVADMDVLIGTLGDIFKLGMSGTGPSNRDELCAAILQSSCAFLRAPAGSLMLIEADDKFLRVAAVQGLPSGTEALRLKVGEGVAGRVAETGQPIYVEDIRTDKRFLRDRQLDLEARAMASVPLSMKGRVLGVLNVHAAPPERPTFEDREIRLLGVLASQAALALENFALWDELKKFNMDMAQTLLEALSAKEPYAQTNAARTRLYARRLAREMNLPEQLTQYVEYATLMHAIGKIGVGDAVLQKPGKLTTEEYALVKKHPEIGARILMNVSFLAPAAPMILYHQEWFNGRGYPEGLAGEEIPLGARLVSVISVWEAMTSNRPYRRALSRDSALKEIVKGAGTQFDPKVVDAFLRVLEKEDRVETEKIGVG